MGGMTRLLLLLWAGVTVSTAADLRKRIVRGQECGNNERHFHVKLRLDGGFVCGGSLVNNRWIVTAKHCKSNTMTAELGLHPRSGKKIKPMKITAKPEIFSPKYDIMMLKLPKAVQVQPAALPDCTNPPKIGDEIQIAGYGPTADNGPLSQTLQCGKTKVIKCILLENPDKEFCGDTQTVRQTPADSGGGVLFRNQLHGVISDEISFVDVCGFLDWVKDTMNKP